MTIFEPKISDSCPATLSVMGFEIKTPWPNVNSLPPVVDEVVTLSRVRLVPLLSWRIVVLVARPPPLTS